MKPHGRLLTAVAAVLWCAAAGELQAARIGELGEVHWWEQAGRFLRLEDPVVRYALVGSVLLGVCCGLLGTFIVVRRMALLGDALSHAVLPGVALGFLWNLSKDPVAILVGATLAGLLGTATVTAIVRTTRLKEDTALGLVLASYFAVGACLLTMIQRLPTGAKSGIDTFLFGQAAAIGPADLGVMAGVTGVTLGALALFYKELLLLSFDAGFARACGLPVRWLHHGMMLSLAFAVVISLQAVGAVLVSALLITPAAAAYLLTDRLHRMLWMAAGFGAGAGVLGAFGSFLTTGMPTGPLIVLAASAVFGAAFVLGPRHGVLARWWRRRSQRARTERENTLKSIYRVLEDRAFRGEGVTLRELAEHRRETMAETKAFVQALDRHALATVSDEAIYFTPAGRARAQEIVRNHRLWELYLANTADIAADHVHDDAEKIEHVLGEEAVLKLEKRLNYATHDPHGREIPPRLPPPGAAPGGPPAGYGGRES
jgi:ABC-type Mn2+/Zn2+ transport system permease subunit/Mn-dependent DtxR family transcriptional regulator